jgi:hypothetical protein
MASMIEIAGYAYTAGLRAPSKIAMAVAIAEAESGGNPRAYNGKGRDDSFGLWQINMKAHTTGELGIASKDALYDPVTNARAMVKISKSGSSWSPWSTYPLRAAAYFPQATAATTAFLANPSTAAQYAGSAAGAVSDATGVGALAQGFTEAVQTPLRVANWLTESGTWIRIALFALGGAMVIGGALLFARPAAESAAGAATKILPVGKVGALVGAASKGVKQ